MSELCYEIVAEAPLAINERKPSGSQYQEGLGYVPGRLLRGALASEVLRTCQDPSHEHDHAQCPQPDLCRALFGEALLFRDGRPTGPTLSQPHLLPTTAVSCKDNDGFQAKKHGVFDTLIDRTCWELLRPAAMQYAPGCPTCGGRTKGIGGSYTIGDVYVSRTVSRELLTRVAINRSRGVAEDELLYAISALSQFISDEQDDLSRETRLGKTRYVGTIQIPDDSLKPSLVIALERVHHVGSGSSRGLGRVRIHVIPMSHGPSIADRLGQFNTMLAKRWKIMSRWIGQVIEPDHQYFAITLQSDAILSTDNWQPDVRLSEVALWRACGEKGRPPADLRLIRCYTTPLTRGGFQGAWGLPKETDMAVQAGGVFLYEVNDLEGWAARLQHLEEMGVGNRRAEGFGQVRICDPFHYEAVEEAK